MFLVQADRARKNAENELHDATTHISEINIQLTSINNDKRRMEGDIHTMQRDLDDAISQRRAAEDRADKMSFDLNKANEQLRLEQENYGNAEALRKQLEVQMRELTLRLDEAESTKDGRKSIAKLQNRVKTSIVDMCIEFGNRSLARNEFSARCTSLLLLSWPKKINSDDASDNKNNNKKPIN